MREILFRGKRVDKGEWVNGDLTKSKDKYYIHPQANVFKVNNELSKLIVLHEVVPETVGQFTGLTDKNGTKIFEGDIVEFTDKYTRSKGRAEIVFEAFKWKYSGCYYGGNPIVWLCIEDRSVEFEVIGNIHDNPELLKGDEE
ncbi:MAG: YopX family protein [Christensenellales bacterium]